CTGTSYNINYGYGLDSW
nr:immunoglobulin heavy chain junction region [Macaca mulatta]